MIVRAKAILVALVAVGAVLGLTAPAQADASGDVVVFSTEVQPLDV